MSAMESAYAATLPPRERRLAARLEGFGDIVFGFAVSQCAIQLPTVHGHVDLTRIFSLFAYFGTFAILVSLWLTFHRVMSESFRPSRFDLIIAFGYLAFVTLMPFAMYSVTHVAESLAAARAAIAEYATLFTALLLFGAILTLRNLRRGWFYLDEEERSYSWHSFLRRLALAAVMLIAIATDVFIGPTQSGLSFFSLWIVPGVTKALFRKVPSPASLRIAQPSIGTT